MIILKNLSKSFDSSGERVEIFKNLNLEIKDGDFVAIVGPSGAGKSTFLNMLSGIDRDYGGDIIINNTNIGDLKTHNMTNFRGKNISYIFQDFKLVPNLTTIENIDLVVELNKLDRNYDSKELLKLVGLESKSHNYSYNLSGGESQRVAIARAFVGKTSLLLADEPTGSLDDKNKDTIMDLILKLHRETKSTIVLITHDMSVAKLANSIYELKDKSLVEYHE